MITPGRRVYPNEKGEIVFAEGDYGQGRDGKWYGRPPGQHVGCLEHHSVTEHYEDGTISVSPSILIDDGTNQWHGYLIKGVWEQV